MGAASCTMTMAARVRNRVGVGVLRRFGPIVVAALVVAAIVRKVSAREVAQAFRDGHALAVTPFAALLALSFLGWGATADATVLRRFGDVRWRDVVKGKAATAVLTALGYFWSNGGYGVWIARRTGAGAARSAGIVLYVMTGDLAAVGIVACLVMPWVPEVPIGVRFAAPLIAATTIAAILVGPTGAIKLPPLLHAWRAVPRRVGLAQIALRCINVSISALLVTIAARVFGLTIPLGTLAASAPILLLVSSLPINVAGIGAAQGAWLLFFLPYESAPRILAFQLVWTASLGAAFVLRGLPFVPGALGEIATTRDA
jgi:hypothetical protein